MSALEETGYGGAGAPVCQVSGLPLYHYSRQKAVPPERLERTFCYLLKLDGTMISIYTPGVADEIAVSIQQKTELEWLVWNEPEEYVDLVLAESLCDP